MPAEIHLRDGRLNIISMHPARSDPRKFLGGLGIIFPDRIRSMVIILMWMRFLGGGIPVH